MFLKCFQFFIFIQVIIVVVVVVVKKTNKKDVEFHKQTFQFLKNGSIYIHTTSINMGKNNMKPTYIVHYFLSVHDFEEITNNFVSMKMQNFTIQTLYIYYYIYYQPSSKKLILFLVF